MRKRFNPALKKIKSDNSLTALIYILLAFGSLMIYNSTVIHSQKIYGNAYRFVLLHVAWVILGLVFFHIFKRFDYKKLKSISYAFFLASILLLGLLALIGLLPCESSIDFAPCINGANRWFYLNPPPLPELPLVGVIGFQPSEFAKLALILYLSFQLYKNIKDGEDSFKVYLISSILISGLILLQPNMSTAVMVFVIGTFVYFSSGASVKWLLVSVPVLIVLFGLFIFTSPYRKERLLTLLDTQNTDIQSESYHINQISIALGSGGFWGIGFGQSRQKYQYLPEVASDSIFAIIGEEFGFLGSFLVMSLFLFFIYKGLRVAFESKDLLARMISVGIVAWMGIQFIVNVAAMSRLIPLTGVPIPLISYGGSSLIFSMIGLGIVANIQSQNNENIL